MLKSVEPVHRKMADKYKEEVEIPEINRRLKLLISRRNDVLHNKPSSEDIQHHSTNYLKIRREKLEERINKRVE